MKQVLQVPELGDSSLRSWQKLATQGFTMHGERGTIPIRMNKVLRATATLNVSRNLYLIGSATSRALTAVSTESFSVWHPRLGHLPLSSLPTPKNGRRPSMPTTHGRKRKLQGQPPRQIHQATNNRPGEQDKHSTRTHPLRFKWKVLNSGQRWIPVRHHIHRRLLLLC